MSILFKIDYIKDGLGYGTLSWPEKGLSTGAFSGSCPVQAPSEQEASVPTETKVVKTKQ